MSDQLIVYKPAGKEISPDLLAKIKKEYTAPNVFYMNKVNNRWFYSAKPSPLSELDVLDIESESVIYFHKTYYVNGATPTQYNEVSKDSWMLACGCGKFPFLICVNDKGPETLFQNFMKFMDGSSLSAFLTNLCQNGEINFATVVNGGPLRRYGKWEEIDGLFLTDTEFYYKLDYTLKTAAKSILAFLTNPLNFSSEIKRLDTVSDLELRKSCEKFPDLMKIISQ
jgi:hypothetical protein